MSDWNAAMGRERKRCDNAAEGALRRILAARLPGGTGWGGKEVPMWQRSEVERLTGLSRHAIQDLCNQNTSRDGLGFWVPAVSKPGYARYDEGDLLAFYLVRQLTRAGFTLAEVEPVVFGMLEDDESFERALESKERRLVAQRDAVEAKLAALELLEDAVPSAPENRLYTIMGEVLSACADAAIDVATEKTSLESQDAELLRQRLLGAVFEMLDVIKGDLPCFWRRPSAPHRDHGEKCGLEHVVHALNDLQQAGVRPAARPSRAFVVATAQRLAGIASPGRSVLGGDHLQPRAKAAVYSLEAFCAAPETGVPIELVFGNGSYGFLAQATRACAAEID